MWAQVAHIRFQTRKLYSIISQLFTVSNLNLLQNWRKLPNVDLNGFDYYMQFKILMEKPTCLIVIYPHSSAFIKLLEEFFGKSIQREGHRVVCFAIDNVKHLYTNSQQPPCFSIRKEGKSFDMCFANVEITKENDRIISSTQLKLQHKFGKRTIGDWTVIGNITYNQYSIRDLAFGFTIYYFDF